MSGQISKLALSRGSKRKVFHVGNSIEESKFEEFEDESETLSDPTKQLITKNQDSSFVLFSGIDESKEYESNTPSSHKLSKNKVFEKSSLESTGETNLLRSKAVRLEKTLQVNKTNLICNQLSHLNKIETGKTIDVMKYYFKKRSEQAKFTDSEEDDIPKRENLAFSRLYLGTFQKFCKDKVYTYKEIEERLREDDSEAVSQLKESFCSYYSNQA